MQAQLAPCFSLELGHLKKMDLLVLGANDLFTSIPSELGQLKTMNLVSLCENSITGRLPSDLGLLANVGLLSVRNCRRSLVCYQSSVFWGLSTTVRASGRWCLLLAIPVSSKRVSLVVCPFLRFLGNPNPRAWKFGVHGCAAPGSQHCSGQRSSALGCLSCLTNFSTTGNPLLTRIIPLEFS